MSDKIKIEYSIVMNWIKDESSILDLGCGDGELLSLLVQQKKVRAQGIELDEQAIYKCVERGISVFHEDLDNGLKGYADKSFDYVVLYQSLQQIKKPDIILRDAINVGRKVIVGIPNFAYYKARAQIFFKGIVPVTTSLPYEWYNTPNLHFLSISDFINYCKNKGFKIEKSIFIGEKSIIKIFPNLFALTGIFLISK